MVKLENENDTRVFIERCDANNSIHDGVEFDEYTADTGLFVWGTNESQYFELDDAVLDALIHYLKDEQYI